MKTQEKDIEVMNSEIELDTAGGKFLSFFLGKEEYHLKF